MLFFTNDYGEGMHPKILEAFTRTNMEQLPGYGSDIYCQRAAEKIKKATACPEGEVFFLAGGTQTNQIVIDTMLNAYEGVIAASTGHISGHEAGAIEYAGHKVITLPHKEGVLFPETVEEYAKEFFADSNHLHMPQPKMVYISYPTEYGTLYSKEQLAGLRAVCDKYGFYLFIDGARLGYGLMSDKCDITLQDIGRYADVFYIGGTKVGAICGEAVVFTHKNMPAYFLTSVKQHGALLAKGRLLGVQFDTLFEEDLYLTISKNAIEMATLLKKGLKEKNYRFYIDSPTNQIFIIFNNKDLQEFGKKVAYGFWEKYDDEHTVIRLATSWATTREAVEDLLKLL